MVGIDDAAMGWSRYAQTMAINMVSSSLLHLAATAESFHLAQVRFCRYRFPLLGYRGIRGAEG